MSSVSLERFIILLNNTVKLSEGKDSCNTLKMYLTRMWMIQDVFLNLSTIYKDAYQKNKYKLKCCMCIPTFSPQICVWKHINNPWTPSTTKVLGKTGPDSSSFPFLTPAISSPNPSCSRRFFGYIFNLTLLLSLNRESTVPHQFD